MNGISRGQSTVFAHRQLAAMVLLLVVGEILGIGLSFLTRTSHSDLSKVFAGGAAGLWFGALLGGVVTLLIADFDRRRLRRASQTDYISNVLADLKSVYDTVDRGRTLIRAHRSAKTYGDEMRNFIEARVKLLNVVRALQFDERADPIVAIRDLVSAMEQYLKRLIHEFEQHYKDISRSQSRYEAQMKQALEKPASAPDARTELPKNDPWDLIAALPSVADFIAPLEDASGAAASEYRTRFLTSLDDASSQLRTALHDQFA